MINNDFIPFFFYCSKKKHLESKQSKILYLSPGFLLSMFLGTNGKTFYASDSAKLRHQDCLRIPIMAWKLNVFGASAEETKGVGGSIRHHNDHDRMVDTKLLLFFIIGVVIEGKGGILSV